MLKLHQVNATPEWWRRLEQFPDRLTFHTEAWNRFISDTQNATPVFAEVCDGSSVVGCFHSLIIRCFGLRILASPLPGWATDYMGFNLQPGVPRWLALQALEPFAFQDLRCAYFEVADRLFTPKTARGSISNSVFPSATKMTLPGPKMRFLLEWREPIARRFEKPDVAEW